MSHNSAQIEQIESKAALRWFFGAGLVAVLLVVALYTIDHRLSTSPRERELGDTLRKLRGAQAALPGRVTDNRQLMPFAHEAVEPAADHIGETAASSSQSHNAHGE